MTTQSQSTTEPCQSSTESQWEHIGKKKPKTEQPVSPEIARHTPGYVSPAEVVDLSHADIADRAYEIYQSSGFVGGRCLENWNQAERELRCED